MSVSYSILSSSILTISYNILFLPQHAHDTVNFARRKKEKEPKQPKIVQSLHPPVCSLPFFSIPYHFTSRSHIISQTLKSERRNLLVFFHLHFLGYKCTSNILPLLISADMWMYCSHTHHSPPLSDGNIEGENDISLALSQF